MKYLSLFQLRVVSYSFCPYLYCHFDLEFSNTQPRGNRGSTEMRKKILQEIHPLNLIREVEKWPVLYEKDSPERANTHLKNKMWLEVSKALFEDWESYTKPMKELKVQELTRKWRNLRDTFKRHVEMEEKSRAGQAGAGGKKKKYVYFKYMLFLLPHITPAEEPPEEPLPELDEYFAKKGRSKRAAKLEKRKASTPIEFAAPAKSSKEEDAIDEDKHFLLSLVPTFKKMSDDEKLIAKMEILKVIQEVKSKFRAEPVSVDALAYTPQSESVKMEFYNVDEASQSNDYGESDHNSD